MYIYIYTGLSILQGVGGEILEVGRQNILYRVFSYIKYFIYISRRLDQE